eukprot:3765124-Prymnesium_polylepis.2
MARMELWFGRAPSSPTPPSPPPIPYEPLVVLLCTLLAVWLIYRLLRSPRTTTDEPAEHADPSPAPLPQSSVRHAAVDAILDEPAAQMPTFVCGSPSLSEPKRNEVSALRDQVSTEMARWTAEGREHALTILNDDLTLARFVQAAPTQGQEPLLMCVGGYSHPPGCSRRCIRKTDVALPFSLPFWSRRFREAMEWRATSGVCALFDELHPVRLRSAARKRAPHYTCARAPAAGASKRQALVRDHFYTGVGGTARDGVPFFLERLGSADFDGYTRDEETVELIQQVGTAEPARPAAHNVQDRDARRG